MVSYAVPESGTILDTSWPSTLRSVVHAIKQGQTVTVSYDPSLVPDTGTVIADTAGNPAVAFTDFAVDQQFHRGRDPADPGERRGATAHLQRRRRSISPSTRTSTSRRFPPAKRLHRQGRRRRGAGAIACWRDHFLTRSTLPSVGHDQAGPDGHGELRSVPDTGTVIADTAGNPAVGFTDFEVDNNSTVILDGTPPVPASAEVPSPGDVLNRSPSTRTSTSFGLRDRQAPPAQRTFTFGQGRRRSR